MQASGIGSVSELLCRMLIQYNFMKLRLCKISCLLAFFFFICQVGYAKQYYLNSKAGSDKNTGSEASPWRTLRRLEKLSFTAGDSILFARGTSYAGGFVVQGSGIAGKPITITAYGIGGAPEFTNPAYKNLNGNVIQVWADHVVVDGLRFVNVANCSLEETVKAEEYWKNEGLRTRIDKQVLFVGAVFQNSEASYLTVKNCDFDNCPIAVNITGRHNLITRNNFHDCNRVLWEPLWGPLAVVIANAYNEVSYNKCTNYIYEGGTFGADGGFIELDSRYYGGPIHDVKIHHNYSEGNEGFLEVTNSGSLLDITYNVSNDYQNFIFFWAGDSSRVENNTVIRTKPANSSVNVVFTFKNSGYIIRNNIFVLANGLKVFAGGAYDAKNFEQLHENNLYHVIDDSYSDPVGQPMGTGEQTAPPNFVNFKSNDFRLKPNSPAVDAGQNLGYSKDFNDFSVPFGRKVDIGAHEYQGINMLYHIGKDVE